MIHFAANRKQKGIEMNMEDKIYEILSNIRPEYNFRESSDFIEDGFLDSFDVVTLVAELEDTFEVVIDGLDILPEKFATVDAIIEVVEKNRDYDS